MHIVDDGKGLQCRLLDREGIHALSSPLAHDILNVVADKSLHASEIARNLGKSEQSVHYHLKRLRDQGILEVDRMEDTSGGTAKLLRLSSPSFALSFADMRPVRIKKTDDSLEPFIKNGKWDSVIVASSPDPHGPESVRGRDTRFAVDIAMFLGTFLTTPPEETLTLDTQLRDWKQNLIVIGGPVVNKVTETILHSGPVSYDKEAKAFVTGGRTFAQERAGVIIRMPNPRAKGKEVLVIAGKRYEGTQAAILAFTRKHDEIMKKELTIVLGLDKNSDGNIDDFEILI